MTTELTAAEASQATLAIVAAVLAEHERGADIVPSPPASAWRQATQSAWGPR